MASPPEGRGGSARVPALVTVPHAREIGLAGAADLAWWAARLEPEGLAPIARDGRARLLVSGMEARFLGVPFRELVVALLARRLDGTQDGLYLAAAWNTSRAFAFVERNAFRTPFRHGRIAVDVGLPGALRLAGAAGADALRLELAAADGPPPREAAAIGVAGWHGPVFLPTGHADRVRWFYGRVGGPTRSVPFDPDRDRLALDPRAASDHPALACLDESGFAGREWVLREDSAHARSRTFRGAPAGLPLSPGVPDPAVAGRPGFRDE